MSKKYKGKSVSFAQKEALISFMQSHPELQKGKLGSSYTSKNVKQLWQQISDELNSIVGATKDPLKWKKVINYISHYLPIHFCRIPMPIVL